MAARASLPPQPRAPQPAMPGQHEQMEDFRRIMEIPDAGPEPDKAAIETYKGQLRQAGKIAKLWKVTVGKQPFIIRALSRIDYMPIEAYQRSNRQVDPAELMDTLDRKTCMLGIVWPTTINHPLFWDNSEAGLCSTLANHIRSRSCWLVPEVDQSEWIAMDPVTAVEPDTKPDDATMERLVAENPRKRIASVRIGTSWFVVRGLTHLEWKSIQQRLTASSIEEDANLESAKIAVIWSRNSPDAPNFDEEPAGVVASLSIAITRLSSFPVQEPIVEEL